MDREEVNEILRDSFDNILNYKPTGKELTRQKEIDKIARQEKEEYEKKRAEYYANPLHWDNNKRRRCGLPVLRGKINIFITVSTGVGNTYQIYLIVYFSRKQLV